MYEICQELLLLWTRKDSAPNPSSAAAHSGPIPIPGPPFPGNSVSSETDSSPELRPIQNSRVTTLKGRGGFRGAQGARSPLPKNVELFSISRSSTRPYSN